MTATHDTIRSTIYEASLALDECRWEDWLALCDDEFYYAIRAFSPEIHYDMTYLDGSRAEMVSMCDLLPKHNTDRSPLSRHTVVYRVAVDEGASWGAALDGLMAAYVEPHLVQPTFIFDYPAELSPLAKRKRDDPRLVERFELFALGYELANAYSEQNDPVEQRRRLQEQTAAASEGDEEVEVADEAFIRALEYGMPPAGGLGIGIERLVMLVTGEHSIREVILFPTMREPGG